MVSGIIQYENIGRVNEMIVITFFIFNKFLNNVELLNNSKFDF